MRSFYELDGEVHDKAALAHLVLQHQLDRFMLEQLASKGSA